MEQFHEAAPNYALLEQHCQYAQNQLHVKLFPNYVAANFLNPNFNYDTPKFWGLTQMAEESGYTPRAEAQSREEMSRAETQSRRENQHDAKNLGVSASQRETQHDDLRVSASPRENQDAPYRQRPAGPAPGETPGVQEIWPRILADLHRCVNRAAFCTWLNPLEVQDATPERWTFRVPDEVFVFWLEHNYRALLRDVISRHTGTSPELRFVVEQQHPSWTG
jgi:hypothetical protein